MLLEDLEETENEKWVADLTEIHLCGEELLTLINTFFNKDVPAEALLRMQRSETAP